jgi:CRP-like cAMP-binding protein
MSVEDKSVVDAIGLERESNNVVLTITDHLEWDGEGHLLTLQEKINTYLRFIESGELEESYPKAQGRKPVISIVALHHPDEEAEGFLERAREAVEGAGIGFRFKQSHFNSPPR